MQRILPQLMSAAALLGLAGCASIQPIGDVGPKKLMVYSIAQSDFLSANRMLVILDKKGNVVASSGGTVAGAGAVGLQAAGSVMMAGSIYYGAKSIQSGLQHVSVTHKNLPNTVTIKGIPSTVNANINASVQK